MTWLGLSLSPEQALALTPTSRSTPEHEAPLDDEAPPDFESQSNNETQPDYEVQPDDKAPLDYEAQSDDETQPDDEAQPDYQAPLNYEAQPDFEAPSDYEPSDISSQEAITGLGFDHFAARTRRKISDVFRGPNPPFSPSGIVEYVKHFLATSLESLAMVIDPQDLTRIVDTSISNILSDALDGGRPVWTNVDTTSQSRHENYPETDGANEEPTEQGCRVSEMLYEVWRSAQDTTAWEQQRAGEDANVVEGTRTPVFATREREIAEGETDGEMSSDGSVGDPDSVQESENLRGIGEAEDEDVDVKKEEDVEEGVAEDVDEYVDEEEDVKESIEEHVNIYVNEDEDVGEDVEEEETATDTENEHVSDNEANRSGYEAGTEPDSEPEPEPTTIRRSERLRKSFPPLTTGHFVRRSTRGGRDSFPEIPVDLHPVFQALS